jgi:hypothetical protein
VERTGHAVVERVAPKVSDILVATARRMEPDQPPRRRRWPRVLAAAMTLATAGVAAAVARSRRNSSTAYPAANGLGQPVAAANGQAGEHPATDAETADINGQVRTP